ncbi:MAG: hypothetical protein HY592_06230 [Candidatus Omnitrophica bacterium]|nr:hypothetical protein [Candidatus Omnitrophota bacterium]
MRVVKSIATALVFSLVLEQVAFAAPEKTDSGKCLPADALVAGRVESGEAQKRASLKWAKSVLPEIPQSVATIEDAWQAPVNPSGVIASATHSPVIARSPRRPKQSHPSAESATKPGRIRPSAKIASVASLPRNDGVSSDPRHDGVFILIQDAHTNTSGQLNLAKILDTLLSSRAQTLSSRAQSRDQADSSTAHGLTQASLGMTPYVFLEAGFGDDSLSFLRKYGTTQQRKDIAMRYLRQGVLHGEELLDLTSDHRFQLWGVEDRELYLKAIEAYRRTAKARGKFETYLSQIQNTINTLKPRIYNPALLSFDEKVKKYQKGQTSSLERFSVISSEARNLIKKDFSAYGLEMTNLNALGRLKTLESNIDFKKASREQVEAIASLPEADQKELLELARGVKAPAQFAADDRSGQNAYYALLEEKIGVRSYELGDRKYEELLKYIAYLRAASRIDAGKIIEEQAALEAAIYASLARTPDEANLRRCDRVLGSLKKLFSFTLTPEEFEAYRRDSKDFSIINLTGFLNQRIMELGQHYERALFLKPGFDEVVAAAEKFYELTIARDKAFIENALKKLDSSTAILIAGGYHAPNLKSLLKQRGLSYISIRPQVLHETNHRRYERLLLNQKLAVIPSPSAPLGINSVEGSSRLATARLVPMIEGARFAEFSNQIKSLGGARLARGDGENRVSQPLSRRTRMVLNLSAGVLLSGLLAFVVYINFPTSGSVQKFPMATLVPENLTYFRDIVRQDRHIEWQLRREMFRKSIGGIVERFAPSGEDVSGAAIQEVRQYLALVALIRELDRRKINTGSVWKIEDRDSKALIFYLKDRSILQFDYQTKQITTAAVAPASANKTSADRRLSSSGGRLAVRTGAREETRIATVNREWVGMTVENIRSRLKEPSDSAEAYFNQTLWQPLESNKREIAENEELRILLSQAMRTLAHDLAKFWTRPPRQRPIGLPAVSQFVGEVQNWLLRNYLMDRLGEYPERLINAMIANEKFAAILFTAFLAGFSVSGNGEKGPLITITHRDKLVRIARNILAKADHLRETVEPTPLTLAIDKTLDHINKAYPQWTVFSVSRRLHLEGVSQVFGEPSIVRQPTRRAPRHQRLRAGAARLAREGLFLDLLPTTDQAPSMKKQKDGERRLLRSAYLSAAAGLFIAVVSQKLFMGKIIGWNALFELYFVSYLLIIPTGVFFIWKILQKIHRIENPQIVLKIDNRPKHVPINVQWPAIAEIVEVSQVSQNSIKLELDNKTLMIVQSSEHLAAIFKALGAENARAVRDQVRYRLPGDDWDTVIDWAQEDTVGAVRESLWRIKPPSRAEREIEFSRGGTLYKVNIRIKRTTAVSTPRKPVRAASDVRLTHSTKRVTKGEEKIVYQGEIGLPSSAANRNDLDLLADQIAKSIKKREPLNFSGMQVAVAAGVDEANTQSPPAAARLAAYRVSKKTNLARSIKGLRPGQTRTVNVRLTGAGKLNFAGVKNWFALTRHGRWWVDVTFHRDRDDRLVITDVRLERNAEGKRIDPKDSWPDGASIERNSNGEIVAWYASLGRTQFLEFGRRSGHTLTVRKKLDNGHGSLHFAGKRRWFHRSSLKGQTVEAVFRAFSQDQPGIQWVSPLETPLLGEKYNPHDMASARLLSEISDKAFEIEKAIEWTRQQILSALAMRIAVREGHYGSLAKLSRATKIGHQILGHIQNGAYRGMPNQQMREEIRRATPFPSEAEERLDRQLTDLEDSLRQTKELFVRALGVLKQTEKVPGYIIAKQSRRSASLISHIFGDRVTPSLRTMRAIAQKPTPDVWFPVRPGARMASAQKILSAIDDQGWENYGVDFETDLGKTRTVTPSEVELGQHFFLGPDGLYGHLHLIRTDTAEELKPAHFRQGIFFRIDRIKNNHVTLADPRMESGVASGGEPLSVEDKGVATLVSKSEERLSRESSEIISIIESGQIDYVFARLKGSPNDLLFMVKKNTRDWRYDWYDPGEKTIIIDADGYVRYSDSVEQGRPAARLAAGRPNSDSRILAAVRELESERDAGTLTKGITKALIAQRAEVRPNTVTNRIRKNPVIRDAVQRALSTTSDIKILQAVEQLSRRGGATSQAEIAKRAGVNPHTVASRIGENATVATAVQPLTQGTLSDTQILQAIKELKQREQAGPITIALIARQAGLGPGTVSARRQINPNTRWAIDEVVLDNDGRILAAVARIREKRAGKEAIGRVTQKEIAREAGLHKSVISRRKKVNEKVREAVESVLAKPVLVVEGAAESPVGIGARLVDRRQIIWVRALAGAGVMVLGIIIDAGAFWSWVAPGGGNTKIVPLIGMLLIGIGVRLFRSAGPVDLPKVAGLAWVRGVWEKWGKYWQQREIDKLFDETFPGYLARVLEELKERKGEEVRSTLAAVNDTFEPGTRERDLMDDAGISPDFLTAYAGIFGWLTDETNRATWWQMSQWTRWIEALEAFGNPRAVKIIEAAEEWHPIDEVKDRAYQAAQKLREESRTSRSPARLAVLEGESSTLRRWLNLLALVRDAEMDSPDAPPENLDEAKKNVRDFVDSIHDPSLLTAMKEVLDKTRRFEEQVAQRISEKLKNKAAAARLASDRRSFFQQVAGGLAVVFGTGRNSTEVVPSAEQAVDRTGGLPEEHPLLRLNGPEYVGYLAKWPHLRTKLMTILQYAMPQPILTAAWQRGEFTSLKDEHQIAVDALSDMLSDLDERVGLGGNDEPVSQEDFDSVRNFLTDQIFRPVAGVLRDLREKGLENLVPQWADGFSRKAVANDREANSWSMARTVDDPAQPKRPEADPSVSSVEPMQMEISPPRRDPYEMTPELKRRWAALPNVRSMRRSRPGAMNRVPTNQESIAVEGVTAARLAGDTADVGAPFMAPEAWEFFEGVAHAHSEDGGRLAVGEELYGYKRIGPVVIVLPVHASGGAPFVVLYAKNRAADLNEEIEARIQQRMQKVAVLVDPIQNNPSLKKIYRLNVDGLTAGAIDSFLKSFKERYEAAGYLHIISSHGRQDDVDRVMVLAAGMNISSRAVFREVDQDLRDDLKNGRARIVNLVSVKDFVMPKEGRLLPIKPLAGEDVLATDAVFALARAIGDADLSNPAHIRWLRAGWKILSGLDVPEGKMLDIINLKASGHIIAIYAVAPLFKKITTRLASASQTRRYTSQAA